MPSSPSSPISAPPPPSFSLDLSSSKKSSTSPASASISSTPSSTATAPSSSAWSWSIQSSSSPSISWLTSPTPGSIRASTSPRRAYERYYLLHPRLGHKAGARSSPAQLLVPRREKRPRHRGRWSAPHHLAALSCHPPMDAQQRLIAFLRRPNRRRPRGTSRKIRRLVRL